MTSRPPAFAPGYDNNSSVFATAVPINSPKPLNKSTPMYTTEQVVYMQGVSYQAGYKAACKDHCKGNVVDVKLQRTSTLPGITYELGKLTKKTKKKKTKKKQSKKKQSKKKQTKKKPSKK